ncbi:methyl-accepting chemotaxis protein [Vibrio sp. SCSIO 43136]|uniref:methyl-accepting chemotaxis protein n=1 Tax=Vibrio sp. SCSIO 43136 TaxID=2819101 RepID=UPI0020750471|nr:methyl-accepting chemotaxis protein [Vibrio sp. SCSIO 43136]USD67737.1 methyl-accepting chemotaxis protein [Vibrio sp. SCSIO 43136]
MIRSKLRIISGVLLIMAFALSLTMIFKLNEVSSDMETLENTFQPIERKYLELQLNVGSLEQSLLAYAVTQGAYDGLSIASQYYQQSKKLLGEIEALSSSQAELGQLLDKHHDFGLVIAAAYVEQGVDAGNLMLGDFDALSVRIFELVETNRQIADKTAKTLEASVDERMQWFKLLVYLFASAFIITIFGFYYSLSRYVFSPLRRLGEMVKDLASGKGDLTKRLRATRSDELGIIAGDINQFIAKTQELLQAVSHAGDQLGQSAKALESSMTSTLSGITKQEREIEATSHSAQQVAEGSIEVSKHTVDASLQTNDIHENSESVRLDVDASEKSMILLASKMEEAQQVIHRLGEDSNNIGSMLEVIRGISEQTNLLALNAAIEAARAGEQGRGFAVVADEVRSLAGNTSDSTDKINQVIEQLAHNVSHAIDVVKQCSDTTCECLQTVNSMGSSIKGISHAVEGLNSMNTQIATASEEQSEVLNEIDRNMTDIAQVTRDNSQSVSQLGDIVEQLQRSTKELDSHLAQFQY